MSDPPQPRLDSLTSRHASGNLDSDVVDIWATAYRHGITEAGIRHALRNSVKSLVTVDDMILIIGPAADAQMLEIGVGRSGSVVHAMAVRRKYWP